MVISSEIQCSVHSPNAFIQTHRYQLLPDWTVPVLSVLIVLQRPCVSLVSHTSDAESSKDTLRDRFIALGYDVARRLEERGYVAELFDPRTGFPLLSLPGSIRLDDVAVAHSMLGYDKADVGGCISLLHPIWGQTVYPSTLVSSARPYDLAQVVAASLGDRPPTRNHLEYVFR